MSLFDQTLNTSRLVLRKIMYSDTADMFEFTSEVEISKHLSWYPHKSLYETKVIIERILSEYQNSIDYFSWGIILKSEEKLIGTVRLFDISFPNRRLELSYILNSNYQGNGYMTEAIQEVFKFCLEKGFNRFQARCTINNYASEKVMLRLGMKYEGLLKGYWVNKNLVKDAKIYAIVFENELDEI